MPHPMIRVEVLEAVAAAAAAAAAKFRRCDCCAGAENKGKQATRKRCAVAGIRMTLLHIGTRGRW